MVKIFVIIQLICLNLTFVFSDYPKFSIQIQNILCNEYDPEIFSSVKCSIRAKRNQRGILTILLVLVKPISDAWNHIQLFSRTTTGHYQPWLLNLDLNSCDSPKIYTNETEVPSVVKPFLEFMAQAAPEIKTGCPYHGPFNLTDVEFDKEAARLLPPIMPEGKFYLDQRFHTASNDTILNVKMYFEIRPIGTAQLIKLG